MVACLALVADFALEGRPVSGVVEIVFAQLFLGYSSPGSAQLRSNISLPMHASVLHVEHARSLLVR